MYDLHVHTIFSDGDFTPEEVVEVAVSSGVTALAIADHDTIDGLLRGRLAAKKTGLEFFDAIEISVRGNRELHILGYGIDTSNSTLTEKCTEFKQLRHERANRIIEYLICHGINISVGDVKSANGGREHIGRPHFASAMVHLGYVSNIREAFDKYLGTPEFDEVERPKPSAQEGIDLILGSGGVPVLAHPALLRLSDEVLNELVLSLKKFGLCGIECHYSMHSAEETYKYQTLAKKYDLIVTGGSDFHGEKIKPDIKIGTGINGSVHFNDKSMLDKLRRKIR